MRRRAIAASRSPAAQPSVRACRPATCPGVSSRPVALSSAAVSSRAKRRTSTRSSCNRPSSRSRGTEIGGSDRLARTSRRPAGRRRTSRPRSCRTSRVVSSCTSSRTSRTGGSRVSSVSTSSPTASVSRVLPGPAVSSLVRRLSEATDDVASSAVATAAHSRRASLSSTSRETHAVSGPSPLRTQSASISVFPEPGGAMTTMTWAAPARSRSRRSLGRGVNSSGSSGTTILLDGMRRGTVG